MKCPRCKSQTYVALSIGWSDDDPATLACENCRLHGVVKLGQFCWQGVPQSSRSAREWAARRTERHALLRTAAWVFAGTLVFGGVTLALGPLWGLLGLTAVIAAAIGSREVSRVE